MKTIRIAGQILLHVAPLLLALWVLRLLGFAWWSAILLAMLVAIAFWCFKWALVEVNELDEA